MRGLRVDACGDLLLIIRSPGVSWLITLHVGMRDLVRTRQVDGGPSRDSMLDSVDTRNHVAVLSGHLDERKDCHATHRAPRSIWTSCSWSQTRNHSIPGVQRLSKACVAQPYCLTVTTKLRVAHFPPRMVMRYGVFWRLTMMLGYSMRLIVRGRGLAGADQASQ